MNITPVKDISAKDLKAYMSGHREESYLLVDVREPKEYRQGHIPGSVLLPLKEVEAGITDFDLEKDLFFYCRSGRRSRIAANLVADMGVSAERIFNLAGGILAWQGKKLQDFPRVSVFPAAGDISSILIRAIELEKGAQTFYTACAGLFEHETISRDAAALAKLEMEHARVIYRILKRYRPDLENFEKMFENAPGDIIEGGLSVTEAVNRLKNAEGDTCVNFFELALEIEFMAYELYKNLAAITGEKEIALEMLALSEQEKGHTRVVANMLSRCL